MTVEQVLVAAFVVLEILVAVVWATIAAILWRLPGTRGVAHTAKLPLVAMSTLMSVGYIVGALLTLVPPSIHQARPDWLRAVYLLGNVCFVGAAAAFGHAAWRLPVGAPPPGRVRLGILYGSAAAVLLLDAMSSLAARPRPMAAMADAAIHGGWVVVVLLAAGWRIARVARTGGWNPNAVFVLRRRDVAVIAVLALIGVAMFALLAGGGWDVYPWALLGTNVAVGVLAAVPFAVRALGAIVRALLLASGALLATGGVYATAHLLVLPRVPTPLVAAAHAGTIVLIVALLVPGQRWLAAAIDRLILRNSRRQGAELQAVVQGLSPELGRIECTRRVLDALVRVLALRGAAIVLRDGSGFGAGAIDVEPLRAGWPRAAAADVLPRLAFFGPDLTTPELRDLLVEQGIAGVVPIVSPQRRWGDLFVSTGLLGTAFAEENLALMDAVARQLALLLDGTALLERAVAVERSLAQAEKLAAIGETAARIAHDIRNPVTAARSLAQQLAREPAAPFREELGVILEELDRVERQVADLLQFARRDDLRFERVDLGALAQATLAQLRPRLEAAGVMVALDLAPGIEARADRERLRQVIVNLVENAADALAGTPRRELSVEVAGANGSASLRVSDTGSGVPAEALTHLFEPFFSLKPHGTGLGLAIAKRTVDAHGGTIAASQREGRGMTFELTLPEAP